MTTTPADDGTIDITNLVETMKATFVTAGKDYLMGLVLAIPGIGSIASWFIKVLFGDAITWLLNQLTGWAVLEAFFINTAIRKASQAGDYVAAVAAKNNLPPTASDDDYEKMERAEMVAFSDFVRITN